MKSRCRVCQRFKKADGVLMCPRCVAESQSYRQDATVRPATLGDPTSHTTGTQRATDGRPGRQRTTVTEDRGVRYRDRDRRETKTLTVNRRSKRLRESWMHAESGEEHVKSVPLSGDPTLHGKSSATLFERKQHPPGQP